MLARSFVAVASFPSLATAESPNTESFAKWKDSPSDLCPMKPQVALLNTQIQFLLETASRHGLISSFWATREVAEISRRTRRLGTKASTHKLD